VDEALGPLGLERRIVTVVTGFGAALALARSTDLVATVPERHTGNLRAGMHAFGLPVRTPELTVSMLWHPRLDADPVHRWLRGCIREVCAGRSVRAHRTALRAPAAHSHSMVAGGLLEMS
jgi:DNA-binding transcriptional LysR family regulator